MASEFPVEVSLGHYANNGGNYVVAFITNISVRKAAEAEIEKLNIDLENTVIHADKGFAGSHASIGKIHVTGLKMCCLFKKHYWILPAP